jgi:hypothetical protein
MSQLCSRTNPARWVIGLTLVFLWLPLPGCDRPEEAAVPEPAPFDSLTDEEKASFIVDVTRYPEMQEGRLDTVDMKAEVRTGPEDGAGWHVQAVNYAPDFIALTYVFFYTGPDSVTRFAADHQPRLVDDQGNMYEGLLLPDNPRLEIEANSTGMGVYVFEPALVQDADSLTLLINDATAPVMRVGPWGVYHTPADTGATLRLQPGD